MHSSFDIAATHVVRLAARQVLDLLRKEYAPNFHHPFKTFTISGCLMPNGQSADLDSLSSNHCCEL